ncbi:SGNH/GDSL hydrolase family protein [Secundilactobacillus similis]|nr:SGNH/GDSL hydrolase family protein [Secundilactobacillus similis]
MSMVSLGDSITKGWTGVDYATTPYPKQVGETLGMTSTNLGENNGKVVGSSSLDLTYNIDNHNFDKDDVATISYGVNDYFHDLSLMSVQSTLDQELTELQAQYPNLQIFGLLPLNCYVADATTGEYVSAATTMYKDHAYTLNDLRDMEAEVYKAHNIKVLDWRDYEGTIIPTDDARMTVFGDQRLHPTQATYTEMSGYISDFLQNNIK